MFDVGKGAKMRLGESITQPNPLFYAHIFLKHVFTQYSNAQSPHYRHSALDAASMNVQNKK